jgi:hypothetical protein
MAKPMTKTEWMNWLEKAWDEAQQREWVGLTDEQIEEAIEVLEDASAEMLMETGDKNYYIEAIAVLRQALVDADDTSQERVDEIVKDEHEPVAWANSFDLQNFDMKVRTCPDLHHTVPLYTAPPKQWVGLTDEEVSYCRYAATFCDELDTAYMAELIEQALKEKNNG